MPVVFVYFGKKLHWNVSTNFFNHVWFDSVSLFDMFDIQLSVQMFRFCAAHWNNIVTNATIVGS